VSEFRVEKHRVSADLTLVTGAQTSGSFFVSDSTAMRTGPERVGDLLNGQDGFFPFERADGTTALYNRAHVVVVTLPTDVPEAEMDTGYRVARRRLVAITLSNNVTVAGTVAVYRPVGRDRLSDYARGPERFWYVVTARQTVIVNSDHIVELTELAD
jgi:hypothetical protein